MNKTHLTSIATIALLFGAQSAYSEGTNFSNLQGNASELVEALKEKAVANPQSQIKASATEAGNALSSSEIACSINLPTRGCTGHPTLTSASFTIDMDQKTFIWEGVHDACFAHYTLKWSGDVFVAGQWKDQLDLELLGLKKRSTTDTGPNADRDFPQTIAHVRLDTTTNEGRVIDLSSIRDAFRASETGIKVLPLNCSSGE